MSAPWFVLLRAASKGAVVGGVWVAMVTSLRLGYVLPVAFLVGLCVAMLAVWKEQRASAVGPWPTVAAATAYLVVVLALVALLVSESSTPEALGLGTSEGVR